MFLEKLFAFFFDQYDIISLTENDNYFSCSVSSSSYRINNNSIQELFSFLQGSDRLTLTIQVGEEEAHTITSSKYDIKEFQNKLENDVKYHTEELIVADLTIEKRCENNVITIYDLNIFAKNLSSLSIQQGLAIFARVLSSYDYVIFSVVGLDTYSSSPTVIFKPFNQKDQFGAKISRNERIDKIKSVSYFSNIETSPLIPDDFEFNTSLPLLEEIFRKYRLLLSICSIYDITTLQGNTIEYRISGYKTLKGVLDFSNTDIKELEEYHRIYKWVFEGGNLHDKIGLARNIISLNLVDNTSPNLIHNTFHSIQSSYKVYEKQNIKQYIEIRNKVSDQLLGFNDRANKIVENFAAGFQKSSLALISFYISAIALKVLGKGDSANVFNAEITLFSLCFLIGAFIYFLISRWEVNEQKKRFINSYANIKERYTDLLNDLDIQRILNSDKEYNADLKFINDKLKWYSILWCSILFLLTTATIVLFVIYNISLLINTKI